MAAPNVDLVFVLDASHSMKPCFSALCQHMRSILAPMQGQVNQVRFGLVVQNAVEDEQGRVFFHSSLPTVGDNLLEALYATGEHQGPNQQPLGKSPEKFFTSDAALVTEALSAVKVRGDEEMLLALDVALDFPFGELANTKRVVAMFSDEKLEDGITKGAYAEKIPELIEKIHQRKIKLFAALPGSESAWRLGEADQSEIEEVQDGGGLGSVDFAKLLSQMGKSISGSSLQAVREPEFQRAIFGQDKWGSRSFEFNSENIKDNR